MICMEFPWLFTANRRKVLPCPILQKKQACEKDDAVQGVTRLVGG